MIDFRSDTVTKPTEQMMRAINQAELGDDGRVNSDGKGEDPTVNKIEAMAARLTGKEDALFCNSGTMANLVALLTYTKRSEQIAVDAFSHIYQSEKSIFMEEYFGRKPVFYESDTRGKPILTTVDMSIKKGASLVCLENTFSHKGGTCLSAEETNLFCERAHTYGIPIHLDGARIFNAAAYVNESVEALVALTTSVQFCLSKGLGAPIGSMLCGSKAFILKARKVRKLIGGGMRQAGIIAAAGIEALQNLQWIEEDHTKTLLLFSLIKAQPNLFLLNNVESNIIIIDLTPGELAAIDVARAFDKRGLQVKVISEKQLRMTVHKDITEQDIKRASIHMNTYFTAIKEK